jgi:hypothetical protein
MATLYDNAELAAIEMVREAHKESMSPDPRSMEILAVAQRLQEQDGPEALAGILVALSRMAYSLWQFHAEQFGETVPNELDAWTLHKLEQHVSEDL